MSDIACCRECESTNVMFIGEHIETPRYYYHCGNCGNTTPERGEAKDADGDVDWLPDHEMKFGR